LADFGPFVITWIREPPTLHTPLDQTSFGSIGHVLETSSVTFENLTKRNMSGQGNDALIRRDGAHGGAGASRTRRRRIHVSGWFLAKRGVGAAGRRAPPRAPRHERWFRARFSSLAAVKLCPSGSQLAFGEPRLKSFLFHSEAKAAKWLRGSTPFTDF